jgi:SPP1 gp7 family putative phage head morphogenesis protein
MDDLTKLEKELKKVYKQASDEMRKKAAKYFAQFKKEDEEMRKALEEGRIKAKEYKQWRHVKMATGQHYKAMINSLTNDMTNANKIAASIINGYTPEAYAYGINFATYQIETGISMSTAWALYDRMTVERMWRENPDLIPWKARVDIPKDKLWYKAHINGAIMQSVLQGESIPETAKRLKQVAEMNNRQAVRTARTAMTACENAGRIDSYKRASGMGIKLKKQWLATMDSRVRDSHAWLDGTSIPINDTSPNGCEYPADPSGAPEEVWNCRCSMIADIEGIDQGAIDDYTLRPSEKLREMSYEEWKESHKKPDWMR